jgi:hypothetical protein
MWPPYIWIRLSSLRRPRCALCRKLRVSLGSPDRHSLLVAVIPPSLWSPLNTPKVLGVPTAKHPEDWGQDWVSASYPLSTESLVQVLSDNADKMRWCPIMHERHVLLLMKKQNVPVSLLLTYLLMYGAEPFLRSCQLCSHSGNSQQF